MNIVHPLHSRPLIDLVGRFPGLHVLVVGDVMLDRFVYGSVDRISPEAPIPVLSVDHVTDMPGGAANVVRNIATLGGSVSVVGVVGADDLASDLIFGLKRFDRADIRFVTDETRPTTVKTRYVADRQQLMRADRESRRDISVSVAEKILSLYEELIGAAAVVILSDYAKGVLTYSLTESLISIARKNGKPIIVDPKSKSFAKYRGATVLTPNRLELQVSCGFDCLSDEQVESAAASNLESGICSAMVVTRGADGMSVVSKDHATTHLKTMAKEVFDVSGAGDTVLAALALGIAAGGDLVEAATLANFAAGIVVGKPGTATVEATELSDSIDQYGAYSRSDNSDLGNVLRQIGHWRNQGLRIAFTNGCFDLIHPGHISLLESARRTADRLVVGLNSDSSVRRLKGPSRPVQNQEARATVLASLRAVDAVAIFDDETPIELIMSIQPDVLIKGADYSVETVVGAKEVMEYGGKVVLVDLVADQSTSGTIKRLADKVKLGVT